MLRLLLPLALLPLTISNSLKSKREVCDWDIFSCDDPYDYDTTQMFRCNHNHDCPPNFKCCSHKCFRHHICQPYKEPPVTKPKEGSKITNLKPGTCDVQIGCTASKEFMRYFECVEDDDCPDYYKCCYIHCYQLKVCQPAKDEYSIWDEDDKNKANPHTDAEIPLRMTTTSAEYTFETTLNEMATETIMDQNAYSTENINSDDQIVDILTTNEDLDTSQESSSDDELPNWLYDTTKVDNDQTTENASLITREGAHSLHEPSSDDGWMSTEDTTVFETTIEKAETESKTTVSEKGNTLSSERTIKESSTDGTKADNDQTIEKTTLTTHEADYSYEEPSSDNTLYQETTLLQFSETTVKESSTYGTVTSDNDIDFSGDGDVTEEKTTFIDDYESDDDEELNKSGTTFKETTLITSERSSEKTVKESSTHGTATSDNDIDFSDDGNVTEEKTTFIYYYYDGDDVAEGNKLGTTFKETTLTTSEKSSERRSSTHGTVTSDKGIDFSDDGDITEENTTFIDYYDSDDVAEANKLGTTFKETILTTSERRRSTHGTVTSDNGIDFSGDGDITEENTTHIDDEDEDGDDDDEGDITEPKKLETSNNTINWTFTSTSRTITLEDSSNTQRVPQEVTTSHSLASQEIQASDSDFGLEGYKDIDTTVAVVDDKYITNVTIKTVLNDTDSVTDEIKASESFSNRSVTEEDTIPTDDNYDDDETLKTVMNETPGTMKEVNTLQSVKNDGNGFLFTIDGETDDNVQFTEKQEGSYENGEPKNDTTLSILSQDHKNDITEGYGDDEDEELEFSGDGESDLVSVA